MRVDISLEVIEENSSNFHCRTINIQYGVLVFGCAVLGVVV